MSGILRPCYREWCSLCLSPKIESSVARSRCIHSMASSDEEGEIIPDSITNYHLVNCKEEPVTISSLPLQWSEDEMQNHSNTQIFLRGSAGDGFQKIYKKVIAWKFELSYPRPELYVLSKDKTWLRLERPRKSFENTIKTVLVTVHCLHFVKRNPHAPGEAIWNHLLKAFSSYEVGPSKNDLVDHMQLISEAAAKDKDVSKSKYLVSFLLEMSGKRKSSFEQVYQTEKKSRFVVDMEGDDDGGGKEDECGENENELFDSVCAFCDNGGELLCCEGRCIRSFHPTVNSGVDSFCESLGYSNAQVEAIQNFLCENCQFHQHQCFVCGMLGSSNKASGVEVFPCVSATCGHFYHPNCVAKLLNPHDDAETEILKKKIASGESFLCPAHKCFVCKKGEDKRVFDLQFAMCRRCPKAYHRKCLPRKIVFEGDTETNIHQRAWEGLLPNRILIYCMDHKIIPELGTPERSHILFPDVYGKKNPHLLGRILSKEKVMTEKRGMVYGNISDRTAVKLQKQSEKMYGAIKGNASSNKVVREFSGQPFEPKTNAVIMKSLSNNNSSISVKYKSSAAGKCKSSSWDDQSDSLPAMRSYLVKPRQQNICTGKSEKKIAAKPVIERADSAQPLLDAKIERRILALMEKVTLSFNLEEFIKEQRSLSGFAYSSKFTVDKTITKGKVEVSVKAARTALKRLEEGCAIEDAKAVCEPGILDQIIQWKRKFSIYLAPFLHGMRYTSFGRHFTKVEKLKKIVDRLHWYVEEGDTIVDFCCGSNDFSCLMKEKLDQMGKKCSFKNYDLILPKIMGLNPPFGVQASLANQFIDKALKFKPKLLVLIVPKETQRLNEKIPPYDIIWEDDEIVSGKAFYLPGSVDVHNQQLEQWNLKPPPLYLWSRPDWTAKHKSIAQKHGHFYKRQEDLHAGGNKVERVISNYLMEENCDCYGDFSNIVNSYGDISNILDDIPEDLDYAETNRSLATTLRKQENCEGLDSNVHDGQTFKDINEIQPAGQIAIAPDETFNTGELWGSGGPLEAEDMCVDMELPTAANSPLNSNLPHDQRYGALEIHSMTITSQDGFQHLQPCLSGESELPLAFGTDYNRFLASVPNTTGSVPMQMNGALLPGAGISNDLNGRYFYYDTSFQERMKDGSGNFGRE